MSARIPEKSEMDQFMKDLAIHLGVNPEATIQEPTVENADRIDITSMDGVISIDAKNLSRGVLEKLAIAAKLSDMADGVQVEPLARIPQER